MKTFLLPALAFLVFVVWIVARDSAHNNEQARKSDESFIKVMKMSDYGNTERRNQH